MKLTEEMLYKFVTEAEEERVLEELEQIPKEPVEFSKKFEKRMKRLIFKNKMPYRFINRALKFAACLLAVTVISGMIIVLKVDAFRYKFFEVINQFFDTYGITWFSVDEQINNNEMKEPDYLPEGFEKQSEIMTDNFTNYEYSNGVDILNINLTLVKDDLKVYYDTEYTSTEKINLAETIADLYIKNGKYIKLVFYKGLLRYEISINNSNFDQKTIIAIANSF